MSNGGSDLKGMKCFKIWGSSFEETTDIQPNDVFVVSGKQQIKTGDVISTTSVKDYAPFQNIIQAKRPSCSVVLEVEKQGKQNTLLKGRVIDKKSLE